MAPFYVKQFCSLLKSKYSEGSEVSLLLRVGKPPSKKVPDSLWIGFISGCANVVVYM